VQLTELQTDAVTELINIAFSRAAASLSDLTHDRVDLEVPAVSAHPIKELWQALSHLVQLPFIRCLRERLPAMPS
jgi:chemotaxis protein CheC